jgi:hypothetical protein
MPTLAQQNPNVEDCYVDRRSAARDTQRYNADLLRLDAFLPWQDIMC